MTTWIDTRSKPRPNVRRHPLDDYELEMVIDPDVPIRRSVWIAAVLFCVGFWIFVVWILT
jgi:hypothetical protein